MTSQLSTRTPSLEETADKRDLIKMKTFCSVKDNVRIVRRQATDEEKISTKHLIKGS